jgi:hypothetical protein
VTFNSFRETVDFRTDPVVPGALVGISFNMNVLKQKIRKNYYKFQNMLADLGGLYKAALVIVSFFNSYFSDIIYFNEIIEKNLSSMCEKNNTNIEPKHESNIEIRNTNLINLGQSQNKLLNLIILNKKNKNFLTRTDFSNNLDEMNNLELKKNNLSLYNANECKNDKPEKIDKKKFFEKFKLKEIITPLWCHKLKSTSSKNHKLHNKFKNFVTKQLDVVNLIKKLNNLDKICLIFSGIENKKILEDCINPFYYEDTKVSALSEFNEVKNQILSGMSSLIINSYVIGGNRNDD